MKVKLLFSFSFVLASAALVRHGAKLPLSNGCGEKFFFLGRRFLLLIEFKFHHTMLVLNAFLAISEGLVSDNQISLPGLNKLFFCKNIPVERAVLPSKIEHTLKLEPGC